MTEHTSRDQNTDLMRATAIVLVLLHHVAPTFTAPAGTGALVHFIDKFGVYGVDLFFVLSGWLIGGLYWKERFRTQTVSVRRFWIRRWFRTLPPYFVMLAVFYAGQYVLKGTPFDWRYLVFLQNYQPSIEWFGVSWSLCIEEHFYLVLPLLLPLIERLKLPVPWTLLGLCLLSPLLRLTLPPAEVLAGYIDFGAVRTSTHLRFEGLAIGVLLAWYQRSDSPLWPVLCRWGQRLLAPLLLACATIPWWSVYFSYYLGYALVSLVSGCLLLTLVSIEPLRVARWRITRWIALWSYSLYLTHTLIIRGYIAITKREELSLATEVPILLALCLLAGFLSYLFVEKPSMVLRDRYFPRHF